MCGFPKGEGQERAGRVGADAGRNIKVVTEPAQRLVRGVRWRALRGDTENMGVRLCRVAELSAVQVIDRAAGQMFNEVDRPEVCGMLWHPEALAACRDEGRLWVITGAEDWPAGFLVTDMVDGCVHIEQVSVDPGNARRGLGRALLDHAAEQAAAAGVPALTLTTFADVPWNAPY